MRRVVAIGVLLVLGQMGCSSNSPTGEVDRSVADAFVTGILTRQWKEVMDLAAPPVEGLVEWGRRSNPEFLRLGMRVVGSPQRLDESRYRYVLQGEDELSLVHAHLDVQLVWVDNAWRIGEVQYSADVTLQPPTP